MTVYYSQVISNSQQSVFVRLLFLWRGSIYQLVWKDLIFYLSLFYLLSFIYRFALSTSQKETFEEIVKFCDNMKTNIPISFLLGFFVAGVIGRWYQMYMCIPWLNRIAFLSQALIVGNSRDASRRVRLCLMRYVNLAWILLMRNISERIANRFRTIDKQGQEEKSLRELFTNINKDYYVQLHYQKLITEKEIVAMENIAKNFQSIHHRKYIPEYWIPLQWCVRLLKKAFLHGYLSDPRALISLIGEVDKVRGSMETLIIYTDVMIPLVYTQVVIIALYSYFLLHLFASQFVDPEKKIPGHEVDFYVPIFTIFQFLFLMGWLKVAMCVMNPFGDDDEDFQTSDMLNFNLEVTQRSASADDVLYPESLTPTVMIFREQPGSDTDTLEKFLDDVYEDLDIAQNSLNDTTPFELKESRWKILGNVLNCATGKASKNNGASGKVRFRVDENKERRNFLHLDAENG